MALPIRTRLALFSGALIALLMIAVGTFLYTRLEADLIDAVDEVLQARSAAIIAQGGSPAAIERLSGLENEQFVQLLSSEAEPLASSGNFTYQISPDLVREPLPPFAEIEVLSSEGERVPARILLSSVGGGRLLVVGASIEDQREALASLLGLLFIGGPIAVALASGIGWLVAKRALQPVEHMRIEAEAVSASEPGRRLPVPNTRDELSRLGDSLNSMLARLEDAAQRERRFLDDAAHELRTPLANLNAELELALRRARTPAQLTGSLTSAKEETERLVRLAEDLLVLSRAGEGRLPIRPERIDVGGLIHETVSTFSARAADLGVSLEVSAEEGAHGRVDAARTQQALRNLIENSLRHTPPGGRIKVELGRVKDDFTIEVRDTGQGFDPDFIPRALEPFSREDSARSRPGGGTGLGLTIVRAIIDAHGGSMEIRNVPSGGAAVTLRFPVDGLISDSRSSHQPEAIVSSYQRKEDP